MSTNAKELKDKDVKVKDDKFSKRRGKYSKGRRFKKERGDLQPDYKGKGGNDISWHARSKQLLTDAACIPWSWATGKFINRNGSPALDLRYRCAILPGIHTTVTVMTPGCGNKNTTAINVAAQALYTDIRRMLKSANAYEASDVIIYIMAVAEIIAYISWCTRLYATTMLYSFGNMYLPDALILAQGVEPQGLHNHAAEFRSRINQLIAKASQIWIPKGFAYLERARWEYANYYTEGQNIKDQLYLFTPGLFRKFEMLEDQDWAGALTEEVYINPEQMHKGTGGLAPLEWEELCDHLDNMINALVGDSDFQNIAGDLYNRYGESGVESFALIPEQIIIQPVFSLEVLEQMQNARCLGMIRDMWDDLTNENNRKAFFRIGQSEVYNRLEIPNQIKYNTDDPNYNHYVNIELSQVAPASWPAGAFDHILTVHGDPSDERTMLITRCTNVCTEYTYGGSGTSSWAAATFDCAAEWIVSFETWYYTLTSDETPKLEADSNRSEYVFGTGEEQDLVRESVFHYHPTHTLLIASGAGAAQIRTGNIQLSPYLFGELDIIAPIASSQLVDINRVDLMSLFAVPDVGTVVK